ncbi:hypothetical protein CRENPOLYSF1_170051 [Crenothrix polyspora]|uniref:Uncharacterized protein n=1 Tax=Crenothrix polyspora TaxID=360316 RepID=A0A1R4H499_9GAMM|nr:hypothetical protein CRENPOLYSF1_170051 [Crenothrix polyspora]
MPQINGLDNESVLDLKTIFRRRKYTRRIINSLGLNGHWRLALKNRYSPRPIYRRAWLQPLPGQSAGLDTAIYLSSTTRVKGLVRQLTICLRVLCLVEFEVRKTLQEQNEKLAGIYAGNPSGRQPNPLPK